LDGIIARIERRDLGRAVLRTGLPAVDVRGTLTDLNLALIDTDDRTVARLAAEHLLERGFRQFAFCGFVGANYSDKRGRWFTERVAEAGFSARVYQPPHAVPHEMTIEYELDGLAYEAHVAKWLQALPKPVGLMACNDIRGQQVLNACRDIGLTVPDDVAVIGVDNDETLCELSDPPLTSIAPDTHRIGYEAAVLLQRLMAGRKPPKHPRYITPLGVVTRRSTEVLAMDDRHIANALRFIRDHACEGIDVSDVVRVVPVSRSALERRFAKLTGRSLKAEILRRQFDRAKQLLGETDFGLDLVAEKCGFKHSEYFNVAFKRETGLTPGQYRRQTKVS
jgi:LacI family transcriptional regulator